MAEAAAPSPLGLRKAARRGLAVYLGLVVVLSALFEGIIISTGVMGIWILPLMWTPAAASVVARLVLREGFADVSFRFGGLRTLPWYALGLGVPLAVGTLAYGAAWLTGLLGFQGGAVAFLVGLASAATWKAVLGFFLTAGEEIGWRGYMLTRLIDAGVPRPVLASGLIWCLAPPADTRGHLCGWAISRALYRVVHGLGYIVRIHSGAHAPGDGQHLAGDLRPQRLEQHHPGPIRRGHEGRQCRAVDRGVGHLHRYSSRRGRRARLARDLDLRP
jgi:hypothetical protein